MGELATPQRTGEDCPGEQGNRINRINGIVCEVCHKEFTPKNKNGIPARFCSDRCRATYHNHGGILNVSDAGLYEGKMFNISMRNVNIKARSVKDGMAYKFEAEVTEEDFDLLRAHDLTGSLFEAEMQCVVVGKPLAKPKKEEKPFGQQARELRVSGFLRAPEVWKALGTDDDYRAWVQKQPSAWSGEFSEYVNGDGRSIAAHVRRAGESGTGYKAEYACIPLTDAEHQRQHQYGEVVFERVAQGIVSGESGKDWFDKMRIKYVEMWAWDRLKQALHVDSMANADPRWVRQWAEANEVEQYLPKDYREA